MGNSDDIDGVVFHKVDKREWKYGEDVSLRACKITRPALRSFQNNFDCVIEFPQKCRFISLRCRYHARCSSTSSEASSKKWRFIGRSDVTARELRTTELFSRDQLGSLPFGARFRPPRRPRRPRRMSLRCFREASRRVLRDRSELAQMPVRTIPQQHVPSLHFTTFGNDIELSSA